MEELDLKDLISMFLEKKLLIILVVIIFALVGAIYTLKFVTPIYKSSTSLILAQTGTNGLLGEEEYSITSSDIALNSNLVDNYKKIAESRIVAAKVIENLGLSLSIENIQANTEVSTFTDTEVLKITVTNTDPELACKIANELAIVFTERAEEIYKVNNVNILDEAVISLSPSNVNLFKNVIMFAFVGGILVVGYILLVNMIDTTIKTDYDIEKAIGLPVIASITLTEDTPKQKKSKSTGKRSKSQYNEEAMMAKESTQNFPNTNKDLRRENGSNVYDFTNKSNLGNNSDEKMESHSKTFTSTKSSSTIKVRKDFNNGRGIK